MGLITRRAACTGLLAAVLPAFAEDRLRALEAGTGGRLGVSVAGEGIAPLAWRADERFPLCSTFKVLATAAVLAGGEPLDRELTVRESDLLSYAPVSRKAFTERGGRMTLGEACAASIVWSDNTAANLQLARLGGPAALTRWVRSTGDPITRLDRDEPVLNTALPGDPRDTTAPAAMRETLAKILLGGVLPPEARTQLEGWMVGAQTGFKRLRAGLPANWIVGDKTGSGDNGTYNVVAILRPPGHPPLIATSYLTGATAPAATCDAAHAELGRLIARHVGA
ncbi:class A beta-lactamase [Methylobacterium sp. J-067]|uniref:class A beta-lactamase n=1 Tax=Methylobacterium sp. J-067 TaxID=2836648 RepID=UPI001FB8D812|nr:class A beta-lactamase [Methylobacterium sp. J-067]MCJ2027783.1 class A beta-lactamase [Methylobacterium sp. J-067]